MGFFGWLKGKPADRVDSRLAEWRCDWTAAVAHSGAVSVVDSLGARLGSFGLPEDEIEIEREMLNGLRDLLRLREIVEAYGLPIIETGHRVIGSDRCHFTAPASMPDDIAQPSGRLLLTGSRAIFVGGARTTTVPWHAVTEAVQSDRDVVLTRKDREPLYRFRCNSFADAMCGAFLAGRLAGSRQRGLALPQPRT